MQYIPADNTFANLLIQSLSNLGAGLGTYQGRKRDKKELGEDIAGFEQYLASQSSDFTGPAQPYQPKTPYGAQLYGDALIQGMRNQATLNKPESESQFTAYLGNKIASGTATEQEKKLFDQLTAKGSTSVTVNTGEQAVQALPQQLENLSEGQTLIDQFTKNPNNKEILKNSSVHVVTNTKGQLQLEVKPKEAPGEAALKEFGDLVALRNSVGTAGVLYKDKYVGWPRGTQTYANLREKTDIGITTEESQFRQVVNDLADRLLRARSGAQINEQEYARLLKIVPEPTLKPIAFKARLESFKTELDNIIKTKQGIIEQSGKRPLDGKTDDVASRASKYLE